MLYWCYIDKMLYWWNLKCYTEFTIWKPQVGKYKMLYWTRRRPGTALARADCCYNNKINDNNNNDNDTTTNNNDNDDNNDNNSDNSNSNGNSNNNSITFIIQYFPCSATLWDRFAAALGWFYWPGRETHLSLSMYIYIYIYTHVYIYIYIYIHIYIYTYIHIYMYVYILHIIYVHLGSEGRPPRGPPRDKD